MDGRLCPPGRMDATEADEFSLLLSFAEKESRYNAAQMKKYSHAIISAKEVFIMADLENRVSNLETKVSVIETKIDMFIDEMRDRDNQRAAEIAALRKTHEADMKEIRTKQEADMKEIRASIDGMGKHVRNVSVATIAVCVASVAGSVAIALSIILK